MDQHTGNCQNSSTSAPLVGVCDDCCIDGSLLATDNDTMNSDCMAQRSDETQEVANMCDDVCTDATDPTAATSVPPEQSFSDNMRLGSDTVDDEIKSVRVHSSDDSAAEKVTVDGEEKCDDTADDAAVDEPVITAIDVYKGLRLVDSWNPVRAVNRREFFGGRAAPSLFTCQASGSLALVRRLQLYSKLDGHTGCVNALHFNDSGTLLASGSDDLNIVVWKWAESKQFFTFDSGHRSNVFQCKFMPLTGDCHMVSCAREGHVRLAELSSTGTCKTTRKLAQHHGAAHKLAMLPDSSHVFYSCGEDAVVFQVDLRQDKPNKLCVTKENSRRVELYSIHSNPYKSFEFCVAGRDHFVRIYDVRKIGQNIREGIDPGKVMGKWEADSDGIVHRYCPSHLEDSELKPNITCAVYNHDGTEVLASYNDEDIYLFDCTRPEYKCTSYLCRYTGHRNNATVKGVNFYGPSSEYVVSGSDCGNVFLWHKRSADIVNYFHADDGGVINVLEPHPSVPVLATSGLDHDIKIFQPTAEQPTELKALSDVVSKNRNEREAERSTEPDIDSHMLWLLMQHLRRSRRRQMRRADARDARGEDADTNESSDDDDDDDDDDQSDDDDDNNDNNDAGNAAADATDALPIATMRCNPS